MNEYKLIMEEMYKTTLIINFLRATNYYQDHGRMDSSNTTYKIYFSNN